MQKGFSAIFIIVVVGILGLIGAGSFYLFNQQQLAAINSFDDCAKKYPVMESYPAQCNTPDGRHFVQEVGKEEIVIGELQGKQFTKKQSVSIDSGSINDFNLPNLFLGPRWESTVSAKLTFMADPGIGSESVTIDGFRVEGSVEEKLRYARVDEFIEYYEDELTKLGWDIEKSSWADGIDGHSRSYRNGNVYLTIGYRGELEDPGDLRFGGESQKVKGTIFIVEYAKQ